MIHLNRLLFSAQLGTARCCAISKYSECKSDILRHAYSSRDANCLHQYDIDLTRGTYEKYLLAKGADIETGEMRFAVEIASRGGTDMVIDWLIGGMKEEKTTLIALLKRTLPQDIRIYLE